MWHVFSTWIFKRQFWPTKISKKWHPKKTCPFVILGGGGNSVNNWKKLEKIGKNWKKLYFVVIQFYWICRFFWDHPTKYNKIQKNTIFSKKFQKFASFSTIFPPYLHHIYTIFTPYLHPIYTLFTHKIQKNTIFTKKFQKFPKNHKKNAKDCTIFPPYFHHIYTLFGPCLQPAYIRYLQTNVCKYCIKGEGQSRMVKVDLNK